MPENQPHKQLRALREIGAVALYRYLAARRRADSDDPVLDTYRRQVATLKWAVAVIEEVRDRSLAADETGEQWRRLLDEAGQRTVRFERLGEVAR